MRRGFVFIILLIVVVMLIFNNTDINNEVPNFEPLEIEVGEKFDYLNYSKDMFVLNYEIADINNDGEKEIILIIGEKSEEADYYKNIDVVIYNKGSSTFTVGKLKKYEGSQPKIYLKDIDGDTIQDIVVMTSLENMSNSMRIITIKNGEAREIFKDKEGKGLEISGQILDGFKAKVNIKKLKKEFEIDLSENKQNYISSGFYEENGRLKTDKVHVTSAGIYNIEFINIDNQIGIKYTERIKGFDNLDIIEQIDVIMKYESENWIVIEMKGERIGKVV